jgi:hypothetical protein
MAMVTTSNKEMESSDAMHKLSSTWTIYAHYHMTLIGV